MTMPGHGRIAGMKMASRESATVINTFVSTLGLWNGADSFLKERMFGLTGHRGNHAACFDNKVELISKCQTQNDNGDDCRSQGGHQQVLPKLDVSSSKTKMEPLIGALNATARPAPAPAASTSFASSRLFSKKRETAQG